MTAQPMTIGNRIAQKRKERSLSQEALGEQLGVSRQAIYKWESDAAQPHPLPKKRRTLFKICIAAAGICLAVGMYNTAAKLDRLNSQYNNLQNSVSNINHTVNSQINGISNRVEAILKAQNDLTADYGTQLIAADRPWGYRTSPAEWTY